MSVRIHGLHPECFLTGRCGIETCIFKQRLDKAGHVLTTWHISVSDIEIRNVRNFNKSHSSDRDLLYQICKPVRNQDQHDLLHSFLKTIEDSDFQARFHSWKFNKNWIRNMILTQKFSLFFCDLLIYPWNPIQSKTLKRMSDTILAGLTKFG